MVSAYRAFKCFTILALQVLNAGFTFASESPALPVFSDPRGMPIQLVARFDIPDLAQAWLQPETGQPLIQYNPKVASIFGREFLRFTYVHEVALHQLGQFLGAAAGVRPYTALNEFEADLAALALLKRAGFSRAEFEAVFRVLDQLPAGDAQHPAGRVRAQLMRGVLDGQVLGLQCQALLLGV